MVKSLDKNEFISRATNIHGLNKFDYSKFIYISYRKKGIIICFYCQNEFYSTPQKHLNSKREEACPICFDRKLKEKSEYFIKKSLELNDLEYDYSKVIYINKKRKVKIIHNKCGTEFEQSPQDHLWSQTGCPICYGTHKKTTNQFIIEAVASHGNEYDYSKVNYDGNLNKVVIIHKSCGKEFQQSPIKHLRNRGCPFCYGTHKKTTEEFIKHAIELHGDEYDYSKVDYTTAHIKITIIHKKCGYEFFQKPYSHLNGRGCPYCTHIISKPEVCWLDYIGIEEKNRQVVIKINNKRFRVDGFDPNTNTIFEFNGDYWHGNPLFYKPDEINLTTGKTFDYLYKNTIDKKEKLINAGYNVISIWGSEWEEWVKYSEKLNKQKEIK